MSVDLYGPEFFAGRSGPLMSSISVVVPAILGLLEPKSVLDLGCGQGEWMQAFRKHGVFSVGVDISAPEGEGFRRHDLTEPLDLGWDYDMVLCLETGEHLPESAADTLVDSCVSHSDTIVFSAAVVGQEGIGHINCQPHEYWHEKFNALGYHDFDEIRPLIQHPAVSPWYRDNIFVYWHPS